MAGRKPKRNIKDDRGKKVTTKMERLSVPRVSSVASGSNIAGGSNVAVKDDGVDKVATKMERLSVSSVASGSNIAGGSNVASGSSSPGSSVKIKRSSGSSANIASGSSIASGSNIASLSNSPGSSVRSKGTKVTFLSLREQQVLVVLRYLKPEDLVNVAQTNRLLKKCAELTISKYYQSLINPLKMTGPNDQFFRQFGHLSRELVVNCSTIKKSDWNKKKLHILPVIADRCEKNLKSLRLEYVSENLATLNKTDGEKVRKLFTGVNKLYIMDGYMIGWAKLMKNARIKLDVLSLEFYKTDFLDEYVRTYQGLKSLHMSGFFSSQLFDMNPTIQSLNYHSNTVARNRLKHLSHLPHLKNLSIIIMGHTRDCNIISSDFSTLLNIAPLKYLYLLTTKFDPMKATAYISTLNALQNHQKLAEFHFFCQFVGPISPGDKMKFKQNAFPSLKQLSIYCSFPFMNEVSQFKTLNDLFIMTSSSCPAPDFEEYRDIITKMQKLQRLIVDVITDLNDASRDLLVQMCQSRTSPSKLLILIQNSKNTIMTATMYSNTVLMFSVNQPTVSKKIIVFEPSVGSVYDRARLIAEKGECVAINYKDFTKGFNSAEK